MQLMKRMLQIFKEEDLPLFLKPYEIFVTSSDSGQLEFVSDTTSIDYLKSKFPKPDWTLKTFFERYFKGNLREAKLNFVQSFAGYAVFTYLFNVKDRHNGNILMDKEGHLVHIDFGFFLQSSPGNMAFETAPFKFPQEYRDIMALGEEDLFLGFKNMLAKALTALKKHIDDLLSIIMIMGKH
mmetsp:Transcript_39074/g.59562  ORF Transcript_39074/g.59562 Transcript_39074/m.59562 type:complete len:182 (-) Transcript_39074:269-814(-)